MSGDSKGLKNYLPYSRPNLNADDIEAVVSVLTGTIISQGSVQQALEESWKSFTKSDYAVAYSTGSSAIHGMCFAAEIGPGDEVIVPALTFASTANAVMHLGAKPVFADIHESTMCIDPDHVASLVSDKTAAIIAVDFAGRPCDYGRLREIADNHKILLLSDAAHSAGATYNSIPTGRIADLTAFSFNPVKNLTSGEGGMVTGILAEKQNALRQFRAHGMTRNPTELSRESPAGWYYEQQSLGFNYKLSEIHAALGLSQLAKLGGFNAARELMASRYLSDLSSLPLRMPTSYESGVHAWHLFVIRLEDESPVGRDELFTELRNRNIGVQLHYIPVPMHPFYIDSGYVMTDLPQTVKYFESAISLPLHPGVTTEEQDVVIQTLHELLG